MVPVEEIASAAGVDEMNDAMRTVIRSYGRSLSGYRRRHWNASATSTRHGRWSASAASATRAWIMLLTGRLEAVAGGRVDARAFRDERSRPRARLECEQSGEHDDGKRKSQHRHDRGAAAGHFMPFGR